MGKGSSKEAFIVSDFTKRSLKEGNQERRKFRLYLLKLKEDFCHLRSFSLKLFNEGFEIKEDLKKEIKLPLTFEK